jgi:hypothetical protein
MYLKKNQNQITEWFGYFKYLKELSGSWKNLQLFDFL